MEDKTIQLRCRTCGGMMDAEKNNTILFCPYCGSKELIKESDAVTIERIKNETYKDVELNKLKYEERKEKRFEEKEETQKFRSSKLNKAIIASLIICSLFCWVAFNDGEILSGIIGIIQIILFAVAWLMGMKIIKEKKPNMHILAAVLGFLLVIPFLSAHDIDIPKISKKYEWPETGISTMLPKPKAKRGDIIINSDKEFYIRLDNVSEKQYNKYLKKCQEKGFTIESKTDRLGYEAYNNDKYKLSLRYLSGFKDFSIKLYAPIDMKNINWPNSEIVQQLPVPKSTIGHIDSESSDSFTVQIGNISKSDFESYIDECKKSFSIDYYIGDNNFSGDNSNGYHLSVEYKGNNTMYISIYVPYDWENS